MAKATKIPRETEFEFMKKVLQMAKLLGWRTAHFRPGMTSNGKWITAVSGDGAGFPDLVLVRREHLMFIELKRDMESEMSDSQIAWMAALLGAHIECAVWTPDDWPEIEAVLRDGPNACVSPVDKAGVRSDVIRRVERQRHLGLNKSPITQHTCLPHTNREVKE